MPFFFVNFGYSRQGETKEAEMIDVHQNFSPVPELYFLPAPIGAEPGRAKEESRITCMRMLRTPPFFPPKSGEKTIFGSSFQIWLWMIIYKRFLHSDWLKTCQLIPDQWNFISATLNHIRFIFFITLSKVTKEIKICWQLKTPTRTWKCTRCIMQMSYLYASDFPFKNFCKIAQHTETIRKECLGKE